MVEEETGMGMGGGQAQKGRPGHLWQTGVTQLHRRSGPAPARSGGGASSRLQTHVKVSSIIHGHFCLLPATRQLHAESCLRPLWLNPRGALGDSIQEGSLGRAKTPQAVPDSAGQWGEGPAQHLSLLLRGYKGLGAPHQGTDTTCGSGFIRKGAGNRAEDGQGLPRETGVGFGFHGEETV